MWSFASSETCTVIDSVFTQAKRNGNSEVFEVQVAKDSTINPIFTVFYALQGRNHCK